MSFKQTIFHCNLDFTSDGEGIYSKESVWQAHTREHTTLSDNSRAKQEVPDEQFKKVVSGYQMNRHYVILFIYLI